MLPKVGPLEHRTVTIAGADYDIREITRGEAAQIGALIQKDAPPAEWEKLAIAFGTDTPLGEVAEWYDSTPANIAGQLVDAIQRLSHLDEGAQKSG